MADISLSNESQTGVSTIYGQALRSLANNIIGNYAQKYTDLLGPVLGNMFSSGISSATNTIANNVAKGAPIFQNVSLNMGTSLASTGVGLASNYIGQGINSLGGDSMLSRGIGLGVSTGLSTVGGAAVSNLIKYGTFAGKAADGSKVALIGKGATSINPYGLAMNIAGSALGAAFGPSKEYSGKYGSITRTADAVYDGLATAVNFVPGWGLASGAMVLNKGLSNIFGSTDAMTKNDAFLGSAFMPAPLKWINVLSGHTTGKFNNQNMYTQARVDNFMGNAYGDLGQKFNKAREESGKTYGGGIFGIGSSTGAYEKALSNIDFANSAWGKMLAMANLNELQNIKAFDMETINNLRYLLSIQGDTTPIFSGKQGMKIFNNATNHNIGMRLLSGAALIDNKQMILSAQGGTKVQYDPDWSDKLEPYAAGIGLAGDAVGISTAATGVGIPVGTAIAGFANIPNLIIDGYQTVRDAVRSYNDNGQSLGSAAWNSGELLLDATGLKILSSINRAKKAGVASKKYLTSTEKALDSKPWKRVGTGASRVRARRSGNYKREYNSRRNKALEESNIELAKRGVRPALGLYYQQKLTDEMAKRGYGVTVNDAIKSANRTLRQNLAGINIISGGLNLYHLTK